MCLQPAKTVENLFELGQSFAVAVVLNCLELRHFPR